MYHFFSVAIQSTLGTRDPFSEPFYTHDMVLYSELGFPSINIYILNAASRDPIAILVVPAVARSSSISFYGLYTS